VFRVRDGYAWGEAPEGDGGDADQRELAQTSTPGLSHYVPSWDGMDPVTQTLVIAAPVEYGPIRRTWFSVRYRQLGGDVT